MHNAYLVETLQEIGFHTNILIISTYPSTIWDKSLASYAHTLTQISKSGGKVKFIVKIGIITALGFELKFVCGYHPFYYSFSMVIV